ncbi:hypothetical protein [Rhizobium leguminosarum]|uniref:hypothetical protein n=1 Tax=Rhizobium leguminosarum TaxID=384 RepID=UPI00103FA248|nr:hypothetical protein [Rhizobium leguminosarum]TBY41604.1 hypothetical protein E0H54_30920 [Rhizobium leguminosarum bv. viciae]
MSAIVDGILKFIEKNINPKIGIVLFGAALSGILLLKAEIVPASDIPKGTMTLLVLACCLGAWIMLAIGMVKGTTSTSHMPLAEIRSARLRQSGRRGIKTRSIIYRPLMPRSWKHSCSCFAEAIKDSQSTQSMSGSCGTREWSR